MATEARMKLTPCAECKGKLYVNWGFELVLTPANFKTNARGKESRYAETQTTYWLHVCANCKTPYYMDEGELVSASDLVSSEEVQAALETIRGMPTGAKPKTIDP
jgi:hypothetical protein